MERVSPGSLIEIEVQKVSKKMCFKRIFVALQPYVHGFLEGCRPYIGVDSTMLTGKYTGQLASATSVDGYNWLFYVAFAIFDSETEDNWTWFMQLLHRVIGNRPGLVISTNACKGLESVVDAAFPEAEHRECMRHLYGNFMKKYRGPIFTQHLYPAARSYTGDGFRWHMQQIAETSPDAIGWLEKHHGRIWYRCGFSEESKCDYLTNNVSESFNKQIKPMKALLLHELVDGLRELIMENMALRRNIGRLMEDGILPNVIKDLNKASNSLRVVKIVRGDDDFAEVTLVHADNITRRCKIEYYVHDYYSVQRFKATYAAMIPPMTDRSQWPIVDLGYKVFPQQQKRGAGRPRVQRIRGVLEPGRRTVKCRRCGDFGHFEKTCKLAEASGVESNEERVGPSQSTPRKRKKMASTGEGENQTPKKQKKTPKKKRTPKKRKTPKKKKAKPSAPTASVVKKLSKWLKT
ncbi:uncharacterized protein LOC133884024 [Phragmites australis]|uniref:uncharacterized protein LOC133884024 n=1 Tax=Phragmites australis TaxID=29695 RepID=UPI002D791BC0|nr:uncharacterized protein LOC133884024 [Phragmites australis]